jgi:hypothetical protein
MGTRVALKQQKIVFFHMEMWKIIIAYGKALPCINVIRYGVKLVAFVTDRISCERQRGGLCDIIVLGLYAPVDNKSVGKEN